MDHVEEAGAGGVGNVARVIARELMADVVFRQQDPFYPDKIPGFVVADPEELGQRESRQHWIRDGLDDELLSRDLFDPIDLRLAALIAPDERGADDAAQLVEQRQSMHLA